jgi:hypothetical protein
MLALNLDPSDLYLLSSWNYICVPLPLPFPTVEAFLVQAFIASKHKPEEWRQEFRKLAVWACHFICKCSSGMHLVPKLASDRLMSIRLCDWIPFGKYRRESANFPEDSVTPRYERTCNLSFLFFPC